MRRGGKNKRRKESTKEALGPAGNSFSTIPLFLLTTRKPLPSTSRSKSSKSPRKKKMSKNHTKMVMTIQMTKLNTNRNVNRKRNRWRLTNNTTRKSPIELVNDDLCYYCVIYLQ